MNIVDNHPATKYPATDAMAAEKAAKQFQQTVLKEFLDEDESLTDTIDNLEQLFNHDNVGNVLSRKVAFHARRTLVSLKILAAAIEDTP